jgi:hypothetical protein
MMAREGALEASPKRKNGRPSPCVAFAGFGQEIISLV